MMAQVKTMFKSTLISLGRGKGEFLRIENLKGNWSDFLEERV